MGFCPHWILSPWVFVLLGFCLTWILSPWAFVPIGFCPPGFLSSLAFVRLDIVLWGFVQWDFVLIPEGSEGNNYHVSVQQPSCQCPDWRRNHLPCKHLLAVCMAHPSLSWDSIPGSYRDSVLFSLDLAHDIEDPPDDNPPDVPWTAGSPQTADSSCDDATKDTNTNTDYKDAANIMSRARETLTRVHDMTYLRFNKE